MANNLINTKQLIDDLNNAWAKHTQYLDVASSAYLKLVSSAKLPSSYVEAVKTQAENNKKLEKSVKDLERAELKAQRARVAELKLQAKREKAFDKYERQLQREQRQLNRTQGLYNRIQRGVTAVTRTYNDLAAKKALNGKLTAQEEMQLGKLEAKLQKYQGVLKKVDSNIGKYQRNVGNYASGWNGLSNSINQLTREAPAFANSVQTGFMALSNNIPILTDEIGRLVAANKALQAEGKPTVSVFRQIMKSLFSFQTLMSLGITLLVLYGKEIGEWASSVMGAGTAADRMAVNTKKINEESAKLSAQTIPQFKALVQISQDVTETEERRANAIKELNSQYPDFNSNILKESDNTTIVNKAIAEYINKLGQKAKAQASMNMMQEKYNELILLEQEREQIRQNILDKANENRKLNNKELFKTQEEAIAFYQKTSDALDKNAESGRRSEQATNNFSAALDALNNKNEALADKQDEINSLMDIYIENVDLSNKAINKSSKETSNSTEKQKRDIEYLISIIKSYTKEWEELNKVVSDLDGIKDQVEAAETWEKIMRRLKANTEAFLSNFSDDFVRNSPLGSLTTFLDGTFDTLITGADTSAERFAVTFNTIAESAQQAFNFIDSLSQQNFEAQYSRLEQQKNIAIQFAGESTTAQAEIERQYEEKRKAIQRKQAQAQKEQAMFNIAIDTAQAVIATLAQNPPPAGIPLAALVSAIGLAQLIAVQSQQIPQFWQGGEVGGMQDIIVNDDPFGVKGRNYKEVIEKPNGQILTPQGKNVKMRVPKGSYVHPTYDAFINSLDNELINNNIMPVGQSNIMPMIINDGLTKSDIMDVMSAHGNGVVRAINNKETFKFDINERGLNKYVVRNGEVRKIMNSRYSGKGIGV